MEIIIEKISLTSKLWEYLLEKASEFAKELQCLNQESGEIIIKGSDIDDNTFIREFIIKMNIRISDSEYKVSAIKTYEGEAQFETELTDKNCGDFFEWRKI